MSLLSLYGVSIVVEREVSERTEGVLLGELQVPAVYTTTETAHVCVTTFADTSGDAAHRARSSAKKAWPRHKGWGEPKIVVAATSIPEGEAVKVFGSGGD